MSLANEMTRMAASFAAAQTARAADIADIGARTSRALDATRAGLKRARAAYRQSTKTALKDIEARSAFLRGRTHDRIQILRADHEKMAADLRHQLDRFGNTLGNAVGRELKRLATSREAMSNRDHAARRAYLRDLRKRVAKLLAEADAFIGELGNDRARAGQIWRKRARSRTRPNGAAARPQAKRGTEARAKAGTASRKKKSPQ